MAFGHCDSPVHKAHESPKGAQAERGQRWGGPFAPSFHRSLTQANSAIRCSLRILNLPNPKERQLVQSYAAPKMHLALSCCEISISPVDPAPRVSSVVASFDLFTFPANKSSSCPP